MRQGNASEDESEAGLGAWLLFWAELGVLGLFAILGVFFAGADRQPGDYACGLVLAVAAVLLGLLRIKGRFDGAPGDWASSLLVDDMTSLAAAIVVFALLGLAGLFVAAAIDHGGLHESGVALFAVSALAVLLSIKRVFDNRERGRR